MPRYEYECVPCEMHFDVERKVSEVADPCACPICGDEARRVYTAPKFLFKADPRDVRPVWHNHGGFGHSHAPRRGRHPAGVDPH